MLRDDSSGLEKQRKYKKCKRFSCPSGDDIEMIGVQCFHKDHFKGNKASGYTKKITKLHLRDKFLRDRSKNLQMGSCGLR